MSYFLSVLSLGCFVGAGTSFLRYDGKFFELLILCGVILMAAGEIISGIRQAINQSKPSLDSQSSDQLRELELINGRLIKVQLAIERLEPTQDRGIGLKRSV